ncbi:tellurite resistance TerB family protein [Roseomonas sp. BU-1]|uniref:Tellurite resistance TerB family protein n=2 Tax=Falsiroseomonas selenitidurans TaxID=2716335 RepID=A0ABX1EF65_9PROT|nr:tellurite resistance TerB family protein [Falsiroseomonas selenitidurans]
MTQLARGLATLAGVAIEAMTREQRQPAPPRPAGRVRAPDLPPDPATRPVPRPATPWRLPQTGGAMAPAAPPAAAASAEDAEPLLLVRTMVAAAQADGVVEAAEREAIAEQLDAAGLSAAERDLVLADFDTPLAPEALAAEAQDPMLRARLYAAAVAGMDDISAPERAWLDRLRQALGLDPQAAATIEEKLGQ